MNKLLVAVEQHDLRGADQGVGQGVPDQGVAAGRQGDDQALDLQLLRAARRVPHRAAHRHGEAAEAQRIAGQRPLREARRDAARRMARRASPPMTIHHVHACLHKACKDAVRWGHISRNPLDAADPPRKKGDGTQGDADLDQGAAQGVPRVSRRRAPLPLWHTIAMTGMSRGEAIGLRWSDVDLENARLSVRRALIPISREVVVSEPKTVKGRRVIALDPGTVEVLKAQAARQLDEQKRLGRGLGRDSGLVFTLENGAALDPESRLALLAPGGEEVDAAADPAARPAAHPRHPGAAGRHPPQGRLRAPRARHHLDHARHLLARHPGDAGGGGGADRGAGVREIRAAR